MKQTVVYKHPSDLIPYEDNPRENDNAVPYLMNSIKDFGFWSPVIISKDDVIVAGHTRTKAALALLEEGDCGKWGEQGQKMAPLVPCIIADTLSQQQIDEFRLIDNKIAEASFWNIDKLRSEMTRLTADWENYGFEPLPPLEPMAELPVWEGIETPVEAPVASSAPVGAFNSETKLLVIVPVDGDPEMVREMLESEGCTVKELE